MDNMSEQQSQKQLQKMRFWLNNYTGSNVFLIFFKNDIEYLINKV